jgi:hypothetical protein
MKLTDFQKLVVDVVSDVGGIKMMHLFAHVRVSNYIKAHPYSHAAMHGDEEVEKLVDGGFLMSVEYTIPSMPYRQKTFLLPKGSAIVEVKE